VLKQISDLVALDRRQMEGFAEQLRRLTESNEARIEGLRAAVETKLSQIQADNSAKLEQMRQTVEEKLEKTLERRLGDSFKLVSDRLEQVHKGLGEMQALANGVGDLKKVLTNIKVRGTWGEIQLGNLLEQILIPDQFERNVATRPGSAERVEFAIKLPGRDDQDGEVVWLPIDAKFPKEDYERLVEASERADAAAVEEAGRQLETRIKAEARSIRDKYLDPPHTTDFGILYLSTEGLYAEVLRRPGLQETIQREFRVNLAGPTTLAALLNSLQMGFRTLAIQKRSSEVWTLLGAVKTEFGKFGDVIDKVQKKIQEAGNVIEGAQKRSRAIERKLRQVQELPAAETEKLLEGAEADAAEEAPPGPEPEKAE
jgi:DNA recombination protein RmuC